MERLRVLREATPLVCFVLTSGREKKVVKKILGKEIALPFFLGWPLFRLLCPLFGLKIVFSDLKEETKSRFNKACEIIKSKKARIVFVSGKYADHPDALNVTKNYFLGQGISEKMIDAESLSLDTQGNIEQLFHELKKHYPYSKTFSIFLVTSFYHMRRARRILEQIVENDKSDVLVHEVNTYPRLSWKSIRQDYLFNILTEWTRGFWENSRLNKFFLSNWKKTEKEIK
jgi:hypothetical protein